MTEIPTPHEKYAIIIFSEKIKAVQAQRGFFVARSFKRSVERDSGARRRLPQFAHEILDDIEERALDFSQVAHTSSRIRVSVASTPGVR